MPVIKFRAVGDKVRVWNFIEARHNNGTITNIGCHGGVNVYQVLQDNEAKSQWYHNADEIYETN